MMSSEFVMASCASHEPEELKGILKSTADSHVLVTSLLNAPTLLANEALEPLMPYTIFAPQFVIYGKWPKGNSGDWIRIGLALAVVLLVL